METKRTALSYALNLLTVRDRSEYEIRNKLSQKGYAKEEIENTVLWLISKKFLNDKRLAQNQVRSLSGNIKRGKQKIIFGLKKRGISEETITSLTKEINSENEQKKAKDLAKKWLLKDQKKSNLYQRLGNHLFSHGYETETITTVLEELLK